MTPRLLVLGAGGFLGRSISHELAETGRADVILHSRNGEDRAGFTGEFETCTLDLVGSPAGAIAELIEKVDPDAVLNCTGLAVGDPADMRVANVVAVIRLIAELEECKGVHLVHLGSAAEYGLQGHQRPVSEDMVAAPQGPYGASKLLATERLMQAAADGRISATVLRVFNPIGRYSPETTLPGSAARKIDTAMRAGSASLTLGALDAWRDYIDTRDIAAAVFAAATHRPPANLVFNVARGHAVKSLHMVQKLAEIAGYCGTIVESNERSARSSAVDWQCADVSAINDFLGWVAEHTIEESLTELWSGIRSGRPMRGS